MYIMESTRIKNLVKHFIETHNLTAKNDRILVAVSGGKDSITLLDILSKLRDSLSFSLCVAHVDHKLRKDSKKDALFVKELAKKYGFPCYSADVHIEKSKGALEEKAREARYIALEKMRSRANAHKIAVAHTKDDNAETMIFRFLGGSAMHGLSGIQPMQGTIIRPLLSLQRADIDHYIEEEKLLFHEDHTNKNNIFTRNRIRHLLIPLIKKEFNPNIIETLNHSAYLFSENHTFLQNETHKIIKTYVQKKDNGCSILGADLMKYPKIYWYYILREMIKTMIDFKKIRFASLQNFIKKLQSMQKNSSNFALNVSKNVKLSKNYDTIAVLLEHSNKRQNALCTIEQPGFYEWNGKQLVLQVADNNGKIINSMDKNMLYLDCDKVIWPLTVRSMQRGDRFKPMGLGGSKKLSDFFIDKKIDRKKRDEIPLFISDNNIIGVFHYTIAQGYTISKTTKRILTISLGGSFETVT